VLKFCVRHYGEHQTSTLGIKVAAVSPSKEKGFIMKLTALFSLALALITAHGSQLAAKEYESNHKHWSIFTMDGPSCGMAGTFEGDTRFFVIYHPRDDKVTLALSDENMQSLREGVEYEMETVFITGRQIDDGWGTKPFSARRFKDGVPYLIRGFEGKVMLDDIAKNNVIGFSYMGKVIASLSLNGSAVAVQRLRECSYHRAGINPDDPFAGLPHPEGGEDPFDDLPHPNPAVIENLNDT
jgi:hypothetical protein